MGPILFAHNENIAHVMPHVTAHAVMSCTHHMHAGKPATLIICGAAGNTHGCAVRSGLMIFIKSNCLTF